jgi:hypothetical protein
MRIPKIRPTEWEISWKKACGKTTAKTGRQHKEGLRIAAIYKRMEKTSRRGISGGELSKRPGHDSGCREADYSLP